MKLMNIFSQEVALWEIQVSMNAPLEMLDNGFWVIILEFSVQMSIRRLQNASYVLMNSLMQWMTLW